MKECHRQIFATSASAGKGDFRRECCFKDHFWGYTESCGYYAARNGNRDSGSNSPWTEGERKSWNSDKVHICYPSKYGFDE
jgi:hypothetical protein